MNSAERQDLTPFPIKNMDVNSGEMRYLDVVVPQPNFRLWSGLKASWMM